MIIEVKVPEVGESITEGLLAEWLCENGAAVAMDDPLYVLETDKVTMTLEAEAAGVLEIRVAAGETVQVGQVVATLDTEATAAADPGGSEAARESDATAGEPAQSPGPALTPPAGMAQVRAALVDETSLAPSVRRLLAESGVDPARIPATGRGGRLTKEDVIRYLQEHPETLDPGSEAAPVPEVADTPLAAPEVTEAPPPPSEVTTPAVPAAPAGERQTRRPMSRLRQRLAERLVEVQQTAAILTTFNEVDMSRVMELRARFKPSFEERHGVKLGFMSFFVKAVVDALRTVPEVNASIDGDEIVQNHYFDIGVAVDTDRGLMVPVIRDADRLSMAGVELAIAELARKARDRTLTVSDLMGAVFTISNGGVYGNMMSTPIINPPQSAILGMHAIKKRAVVVDDEIVVRPMMYLALSYDHRLVDGREAVTFLRRIADCIENPERMLLEV